MKSKTLALVTLAAAGILVLAGCASTPSEGPKATATIEPRSDSTVTGTATFTELSGNAGTRIHVHIEKAPPGTHGLHIHEKGDCSDPKAASAGGHFNPGAMDHGGPMDAKHHAGDLGNIEIRPDGTGDLDITSIVLTVHAGPYCVQGRSVVFHEKADDFKTQPTGNAGGRLGCGEIK